MICLNKKTHAFSDEKLTEIQQRELLADVVAGFKTNFNDIVGLIESNSYSDTDFFINEEHALHKLLEQGVSKFPDSVYDALNDFPTKKLTELAELSPRLQLELEAIMKSAVHKAICQYNNVIYNTLKYKGGIGCTTFIAHLAFQLVKKTGKKLLLVDLDSVFHTVGNAEKMLQPYDYHKRKKEELIPTPELMKMVNINDIDHYTEASVAFLYFFNEGSDKKLPGLDVFRCQKLIPEKLSSNNSFTYNSLLTMMRLFITFDFKLKEYDYLFFDNGQISNPIEDYFSYFLKNHFLLTSVKDRDIQNFIHGKKIAASGFLNNYLETKQYFKLNNSVHDLQVIIISENEKGNKELQQLEEQETELKKYLRKQGKSDQINNIIYVPYSKEVSSIKEKIDKKNGYSEGKIVLNNSWFDKKTATEYVNAIKTTADKIEKELTGEKKQ